jgi:hypothetical protein
MTWNTGFISQSPVSFLLNGALYSVYKYNNRLKSSRMARTKLVPHWLYGLVRTSLDHPVEGQKRKYSLTVDWIIPTSTYIFLLIYSLFQSLDDFQMLKVLGKGTFGKVMLSKEISTGDVCSIKLLRKDVIIQKVQCIIWFLFHQMADFSQDCGTPLISGS